MVHRSLRAGHSRIVKLYGQLAIQLYVYRYISIYKYIHIHLYYVYIQLNGYLDIRIYTVMIVLVNYPDRHFVPLRHVREYPRFSVLLYASCVFVRTTPVPRSDRKKPHLPANRTCPYQSNCGYREGKRSQLPFSINKIKLEAMILLVAFPRRSS